MHTECALRVCVQWKYYFQDISEIEHEFYRERCAGWTTTYSYFWFSINSHILRRLIYMMYMLIILFLKEYIEHTYAF